MKTISSELKNVSDNFRKLLNDYAYASQECAKLDKRQQDLLHAIEFGDYNERRKLATQLAAVRRERRIHKDTMAVLQPMYDLLGTDAGKKFTNQLTQTLGSTRKAEQYLETKRYFPRIMKNLALQNGQKIGGSNEHK